MISLFLASLLLYVNSYDIKVGLLAPVGLPEFNPTIGFGTSMGAVGIAIDRITKENILPGANIT